MGRFENVQIFEDSMAMMRSHPRLKAAVEDSVLAQEFIAERDSIPSGGGRDEPQAEVVISQRRSFEAASAYARTMRTAVLVAVQKGAEAIVLGAFGCGAFRNDPEVVASAAFDVIPDYRGAFKAIEFAVYCRPDDLTNYRAFKARFG